MPKAKQQEPKLRTSCNNCSSAKVRCEKTSGASAGSPTCVRCTQQNLECVFDVSQRKGKPFQPYPKSKPANVARIADIGEEQQNLDNNNGSEPENVAQNVNNGQGQQNASNYNNSSNDANSSNSTTNKANTYPWPKTGWNLSDVGPEIDFSSVSQNPTNEFRVTLPRKHDMCSVMSNLRPHLLKLEKMLDNTYGCAISKSVANEYKIEFCTIRATIQQLLHCTCHICHYDCSQIFLLATLSTSLSNSYKAIVWNLFEALPCSEEDSNTSADLVPLAFLLKLEMDNFEGICRVIREKASRDPKAKTVGEAFYEMLCGEVKDATRQLDNFLNTSNYLLNRTQNPIRVS